MSAGEVERMRDANVQLVQLVAESGLTTFRFALAKAAVMSISDQVNMRYCYNLVRVD